jgi:hypothetical protein
MPYFVESLLNVDEDAGTGVLSQSTEILISWLSYLLCDIVIEYELDYMCVLRTFAY